MSIVFIVLTLLVAILLICVVLIQKSKGGGLSSTFAGSNQIMGVRRTNNFIEKVTWSLAGAIAVLSVLCTFTMPDAITSESRVEATAPQQTTGGNYDTQAPAATEAPAAQKPAAPAQQQAPAAPAAPAASK
ncbi:MAG: preprotein translocase subunit SecG [Bacteroides sp.]|nr:preprotein translocase subunit SecG [Bacteroides sp.]